MQLRFLGGAGSVTGSKVIVEHEGRRLLLDCGLFQGLKQLRLHNRSALAVPSRSIDAVVLTQAHLAHSGFLPRLVELGFEGEVHATPATVELCQLLLPEAGRLLEEEARQANQVGYTKHAPARPLYTEALAMQALQRLQPRRHDELFEPVPGFTARLRPSGQALGAASVHLRCGSHSMLYAGALGRTDDPLLRAPAPPEVTDQLLVEATYGNRQHRLPDAMARLAKLIGRTATRGGVVLLPAHAGGPAQLLLHAIRQLKTSGRIPDLPVHLDSRIAADVVSIYQRHPEELRLDAQACGSLLDNVEVAQSTDEALALSRLTGAGHRHRHRGRGLRPRAGAAPQAAGAGRAQRHCLQQLPACGHARGSAAGRQAADQGARRLDLGPRRGDGAGRPVRACRPSGPARLDPGAAACAEACVPDAGRARSGRQPAPGASSNASPGRARCPSTWNWPTSAKTKPWNTRACRAEARAALPWANSSSSLKVFITCGVLPRSWDSLVDTVCVRSRSPWGCSAWGAPWWNQVSDGGVQRPASWLLLVEFLLARIGK